MSILILDFWIFHLHISEEAEMEIESYVKKQSIGFSGPLSFWKEYDMITILKMMRLLMDKVGQNVFKPTSYLKWKWMGV